MEIRYPKLFMIGLLCFFNCLHIVSGHVQTNDLSFSKDGKYYVRVLGALDGLSGETLIYNVVENKLEMKRPFHGGMNDYIRFNPTNSLQMLVVGNEQLVKWEKWHDFGTHYVNALSGRVKSSLFSKNGNKLVDTRDGSTIIFDKTNRSLQKYYWTAKKHVFSPSAEQIISVPDVGSKVGWRPLDGKEPVTLDQGENFMPQDAIFSTKDDLMAVASWYQNPKQNDKDLSMVKLYDVTTLKDKVYYFVPGKVSSGSRREPHESTFFVDDNNVMLVHAKVKDGFNTYLIDGRQSNYIVKTVEHHSNVTRLFELYGAQYFAATRTDGVVIFDIRNLRRSIEILGRIQNPTHIALNPIKPGSHAIIAAGSALHTYIGTTEKK